MSEVKALVEAVAVEADASAGDPMPSGSVGVRPNKAVTVSARITAGDAAAVEALAAKAGMPVSALVRQWILSGLTAQREDTVQSAVERLSNDLQRLREIVA